MPTAQNIIDNAAKLVGAVEPGTSVNATESGDLLLLLNMMLDAWATEHLLVFANTRESFSLVAGQSTYTMGTSGNFNTTRPEQLISAYLTDSSGTDWPIDLVDVDWYERQPQKTDQTIPYALYYDPQYPLANLIMYPVPDTTYTLHVTSWKPISNLSTLSTSLSMPPEYQMAITYNLAKQGVSPYYGRPTPPEVAEIAVTSKNWLKVVNKKQEVSVCDPALIRQRFNINLIR